MSRFAQEIHEHIELRKPNFRMSCNSRSLDDGEFRRCETQQPATFAKAISWLAVHCDGDPSEFKLGSLLASSVL